MKSRIVTAALLLACSAASAETITSNGTGGGEWGSPATWQGGIVPDDADTVVLRDTVTIPSPRRPVDWLFILSEACKTAALFGFIAIVMIEISRRKVALLAIFFLLACSAGQAWGGSTITSAAPGNWSTGATWGGGVAPVAGDIAIINHAVIVTADQSIGTSPSDGTTEVLDVNAAGSLTINADVTLTVLGNFDLLGGFTMQAGSKLIFDGSAASNQDYVLTTGGATAGTWTIAGTQAKPCEVRGASADALGIINYVWLGSGDIDWQWCTFKWMGTGSTYGVYLYSSGANTAHSIRIDDCTFDTCGRLRFQATLQAEGENYYFRRNTLTATNGDYVTVGNSVAKTTGVSEISENTFDVICTPTGNWYSGATVTRNVFLKQLAPSGTLTAEPAAFTNNLLRSVAQTANILVLSDITDCYILSDYATANPRGISCATYVDSITLDGCIVEYTGTDTAGDMISHAAAADENVLTIKNSIMLPNSAGVAPGDFTSYTADFAGTVNVYHNTIVVGGTAETGLSVGETWVGRAGLVPNVKSNLFWTPATKTAGVKAIRQSNASTPIQDIFTPGGWDYNWGWNLAAGSETNGFQDNDTDPPDMFSAVPTDTNGGTGDPAFVDSTRDFALWGLTVHPIECPDGTVAQAVTYIAAHPEEVDDLVVWVKAGFRPKNYLLRTGHDAATMGAEDYLETGTYTLTAPTPASGHVDVASGNFTIALAANQYPTSIVITLVSDVAGTFTPATVTLTDADRTKTVTFTPTATGTATITTTNDGSMTNPAGVEYEVTAAGGGKGKIIGGGILEWRPGEMWPVAMR